MINTINEMDYVPQVTEYIFQGSPYIVLRAVVGNEKKNSYKMICELQYLTTHIYTHTHTRFMLRHLHIAIPF